MACKTSMTDYCIACFNGKFGWVPFVDNLMATAEQVNQIDEELIDEQVTNSLIVDFDHISFSNSLVNCKVPFKFSDAAVSTLCLKVDDLPEMKSEFVLKLGSSIKGLPIEDIHKVIMVCGPKTKLKIDLAQE